MNWIVKADFPTPEARYINTLDSCPNKISILTTTTHNYELVFPQKLCLYLVG
jgi:hypothetical protein